MITVGFENSLEPDQLQNTLGPILDTTVRNSDHIPELLYIFLKRYFLKNKFRVILPSMTTVSKNSIVRTGA